MFCYNALCRFSYWNLQYTVQSSSLSRKYFRMWRRNHLDLIIGKKRYLIRRVTWHNTEIPFHQSAHGRILSQPWCKQEINERGTKRSTGQQPAIWVACSPSSVLAQKLYACVCMCTRMNHAVMPLVGPTLTNGTARPLTLYRCYNVIHQY